MSKEKVVKTKQQIHKEAKKACENLYVYEDKECLYISKLYNIPESTIRRWAKQGNWNQLKNDMNESSMKAVINVKKILPTLIAKLENSENLPKDVDALSKAVSALKKLEKNVDIVGNTLMVFREFTLFIKPIDPQVIENIQDHIEPFIKHLQKKFSV